MVKKLFALASVTALTGLVATTGVAGCSSTTETTTTADAGASDASKKDAKGPATGDDEEPADTTPSCLNDKAIDATQFPYNPPIVAADACTAKELSDLSAWFKANAKGNDWTMSGWAAGAAVSPTCEACAFSTVDAAKWAPLLSDQDQLADVNRGGCIEIVSGKPACGKSYQQLTDCRFAACSKCTTTEDFQACLGEALDGPCADSLTQLQADCGSGLGGYETACQGKEYTFEGPLKVQCVTGGQSGPKDAGSDADAN